MPYFLAYNQDLVGALTSHVNESTAWINSIGDANIPRAIALVVDSHQLVLLLKPEGDSPAQLFGGGPPAAVYAVFL